MLGLPWCVLFSFSAIVIELEMRVKLTGAAICPPTDYDFCSVCISDTSKRQAHYETHAFFTIVTPQDEFLYTHTRAQIQSQSVRHDAVSCDSCRKTPLVGVRHRCLDCHGESHTILRIFRGFAEPRILLDTCRL